jgi:hypothetical protein
MERSEADAIFDAGRERVVEVLLDYAGRLCGLEYRLGRVEAGRVASSRNSSTAPSQDVPQTRQQRRALAREKAKQVATASKRREHGAETGHPGVRRELLPVEEIDEVVDHYPTECRGCGHEFSAAEKTPRAQARVPSGLPADGHCVTVTEHGTHRLRCPGCKQRTRAALGSSACPRSDRVAGRTRHADDSQSCLAARPSASSRARASRLASRPVPWTRSANVRAGCSPGRRLARRARSRSALCPRVPRALAAGHDRAVSPRLGSAAGRRRHQPSARGSSRPG